MKMKKLFHMMLVLSMVMVMTTGARAGVLDRNLLPADTQWVIHLDMDMFKHTTLKKALVDKYNAFEKEEEDIFKETRVSLFKDLSSITMFGSREDSHQLVFCLKGNIDKAFLLTQLKKAHDCKEVTYGKHTIYQWKRHSNGVFARPDMLLYSRDEDMLKDVLDLMSGKGKSVMGSKLARYIEMIPANAFAFAAASDISNMARHGYPGAILKQTGMATFLAMEKNHNLTMKVVLNTNSEENSKNIENIIRGLMAVANMAQHHNGDEHKGRHSEEKMLLTLMQEVKIQTSGRSVQIQFSYPSEELVEMIKHQGRGFDFH